MAQVIPRFVEVPVAGVRLSGDLTVPANAPGLVLFAHGSGSSRQSPRNRYVARELNGADLATLLIDLLTHAEEAIDMRTAHLRFDLALLAERLVAVSDWLLAEEPVAARGLGYFGASTGAGAALMAAAERPAAVRAVVSRGGRPDLAGAALTRVHAPTLLIVGGDDLPVLELNRRALAELRPDKRLEVIPGATHLFEEPGALEQVARLARGWFQHHLGAGRR
jgi:putative phosphoribosyl transferase